MRSNKRQCRKKVRTGAGTIKGGRRRWERVAAEVDGGYGAGLGGWLESGGNTGSDWLFQIVLLLLLLLLLLGFQLVVWSYWRTNRFRFLAEKTSIESDY